MRNFMKSVTTILKMCNTRCLNFEEKEEEEEEQQQQQQQESIITTSTRKPGGWKSMPYIIGNESCERLAVFGMFANFTVYMVNYLNLPSIWAANAVNIWYGTTNFAPLLGAFLSDSYLGRFQTLAYASIFSFLGMLGLTMTAILPQLQPQPCSNADRNLGQCSSPSSALMGVLFMSLGLLTVGAGGIRPCSLPFALDQFDATTVKGRKDITSFFNWYYLSIAVTIMIALTVIVYIQDNVGWGVGFGIPATFMLISMMLFFLGTRLYVYVQPEGSLLSGLAQVVVVAVKKRNVENSITICDPNPTNPMITKLHLTQQFKFLNKAALVESVNEVTSDEFPRNPWSLTSVQKIEELKCVIRIAPILSSAVIFFMAMSQQGTFIVLQALKMNRNLGPNFQISAGSIGILSTTVTIVFIPIYDRVIVPILTKYTGIKGGITMLHRIGIGMFIAMLSLLSAGIMEKQRRILALQKGDNMGVSPMSVLWLGVPLGLSGLGEALSVIAQIELYYKELPYHMRSIAMSLFFASFGASSYLSTFLVFLVKKYSVRKYGHTNWLADNINSGRLEYFYYLMAFLSALNLVYFAVCSIFYHYKEQKEDNSEVEMAPSTVKI